MSFDPAEFARLAAEQAQAAPAITPEMAQNMIFAEGPKPFRYSAEIKRPTDGGLLISKWEFEVPNGLVTGWLRIEDLEGLKEAIEDILKEMKNPVQDLVRPPTGLIVPGQQL